MSRAACIFCGEVNEPSKEDVFAKWIRKEFSPNSRLTIHPTLYYPKSNLAPYPIKARRGLGVISDKPCHPCNTRWMSRLENDCKSFLAAMMRGENVILDSRQQDLIVRWL